MIYYLMIIAATVLFSVQFVLNDGYRKEAGNDWNSAAKFSLYTSIAGFVALAIVNNENLSLAIGKKGSNVVLASRLTKYKINVKTLVQIQEDGNK